ncbi:MAG TPA: glycerophosphoryl diester phosphodiesterase membrane domain-containing protein, partial [Anaerolineales bacterium]
LVRSLFVAVIANLALTVSVATLYHRRSISIRQALRISSRRYLSALGAIILIGIGAAVPIFALAALLVFSGFSDGGSALGLLGLILFIPVFLYFALRIGFVHQAIVIENQGASNAIRRSWDLTAGQFWHVFGTLILAGILTYILAGIPEALITFAFQYIEAPIFLSMLTTILVQDLSLVLTMPYSLAITTLLYYNLRVRKEGYDLMVRANPGLSPA